MEQKEIVANVGCKTFKILKMEKTIKVTTRLLLNGKLTKEEADKILLDLHIVSVSDDEIFKTAVSKAEKTDYTWRFDYGIDMAKWMRDKIINHSH